MSEMTDQDVFDHVWDHFVTKGNPRSLTNLPHSVQACAYRGDGGAKCAAGLFIPDEVYTADMEGYGAHSEPLRKKLGEDTEVGRFFKDRIGVLTALQNAHDLEGSSFEKRLRDVAKSLGLKVPA